MQKVSFIFLHWVQNSIAWHSDTVTGTCLDVSPTEQEDAKTPKQH